MPSKSTSAADGLAGESIAFDVYLAYSRLDEVWVEALAERLTGEAKLRVWLDKWNMAAGEDFVPAMEKAMPVSRACAVPER